MAIHGLCKETYINYILLTNKQTVNFLIFPSSNKSCYLWWDGKTENILFFCIVLQYCLTAFFLVEKTKHPPHKLKKKSVIFYTLYFVIWEWRFCHLAPAVYKHRQCWQLFLSCHPSASIFLFPLSVMPVLCLEHRPAGDLQCQWHLNLDKQKD